MNLSDIALILPGTKRVFKTGSSLIYQGEVPRNGFYIVKGIVKVYSLLKNGDERIVGFYGPGDLLPTAWLFGNTNTAMYYHEAQELCETISVTHQDIEKHILTNSDFKNYLLKKQSRDQAVYQMRVTSLQQPTAQSKIACSLYCLLYQFGTTKDQKNYTINLSLTHATIASLVGLTRETTAVEIHKMKTKSVLNYSKKIYVINKKLLESIMNEESFASLK